MKVLISLDDVLRAIKLAGEEIDFDRINDMYMNGIMDVIVEAIMVSKETDLLAGWVGNLLLTEFKQWYNGGRLDSVSEYDQAISGLITIGQAIEKGLEHLIENIFLVDLSVLKILSVKWFAAEQLLLEVNL